MRQTASMRTGFWRTCQEANCESIWVVAAAWVTVNVQPGPEATLTRISYY